MSEIKKTDQSASSDRRLILGVIALTATIAPFKAVANAAELVRPKDARVAIRNLASEAIKDLTQASKILKKTGSQVRVLNKVADERVISDNEAIVTFSYVLGVRG